jgi:hypothetical protein
MAQAADPTATTITQFHPSTIIKPVSRRWLLSGLVAAPAIVVASNIMPVRAIEWIGELPEFIGFYCGGPNPFGDTLAKWEEHLAFLKTFRGTESMIETAEEVIAWKKGGPPRMPKGMPMGPW